MLHKFMVVCLSLVFIEGQAYADLILNLSDLGDLGGGYSYGYAVNNQGHATGVSKINSIDSRAFYWNGSSMLDLGTNPNGGPSFGFDINRNNQIVGMANNQAFRWTQTDGLVLIDPNHQGSANSINDFDGVLGQRDGNRTMFWSPSNAPAQLFSSTVSTGSAINGAGQIAGNGLGTSNGYYASDVNASPTLVPLTDITDMNNSGLISGSLTGTASLFDINSGVLTSIGRLNPGDPFSMALGLSETGRAVGTSGGTRGFLYDSTLGLQDVTTLLGDEFAGWQILALDGISPDGTKMIGVGRYQGVDHAVILSDVTSVPEPNIVGDTVKGIQFAYRLAGDAIVSLCEKSDECEVTDDSEVTESPTIVKADAETAQAAADVLQNVIESGKFKGESKARAEKVLEKLRNH